MYLNKKNFFYLSTLIIIYTFAQNFYSIKMKALGSKSRMKHITHNPTGELVKSITKLLKSKKK